MDWDQAIRRNREALIRVLAALFSLVGLPEDAAATSPLWGGRRSKFEHRETDADPGGGHDPVIAPTRRLDDRQPPREADLPVTLPRSLHAYALRLLLAAESAIRRLIVIAARDIVCQRSPANVRPGLGKGNELAGAGTAARIPAFPLLDPLKRYSFDPPRRASKFMPRICVVGITELTPIPETPTISPDDPVDATGFHLRLLSSKRALANLTREARRLARWYQRNKLRSRARRVSPLRIGHPPGKLKRPTHAVDDILKECQALALDVLDPPNTS